MVKTTWTFESDQVEDITVEQWETDEEEAKQHGYLAGITLSQVGPKGKEQIVSVPHDLLMTLASALVDAHNQLTLRRVQMFSVN